MMLNRKESENNMKKISTKIVIALVLLAVVSLSSFAMLSFSLADENNGELESQRAVFAASSNYTHIDRIIENSISGGFGDVDDKTYHILEITSGSSSTLNELVSNGCFKNYVIDGHRSITDVMAADKVEYVSLKSTDDVDTQIAAIQLADLIYVHNDATSYPDNIFSDAKGTDLKEDVKLALSTAATGEHKPFIIDSYKGTVDNVVSTQTYNTLVSSVFNTSLATYAWPDGVTAKQFMNMEVSSAFYTKIKGNNAKANWTSENHAKILQISAGSNTIKNLMTTNDLKTYGYVRAESIPADFDWETVAPDADLSSYDFSSYDYIVLEDDCSNKNITTDTYNKIAAAAYAKVHILFSPSLRTASSSSSSNNDNPASAYAYLLDKVATVSDTPKFGNVLVTNFSKMAIYANANRAKTVDDIADIIIKGSFRKIYGTDSGDDTSNVYTVLEIEPSYPIDSNLAKAFYENKTYLLNDNEFTGSMSFVEEKFAGKGNEVLFSTGKYNQDIFYYLRTNSVINGLTEDEISFDDQTPLSMYENYAAYSAAVSATQTANNSNLKDYYRWRISKAKIAHATGIDYSQIKVVHMSSAEFNTSREALSGAYDAIYIGGDISSMKYQSKWANGGKYLMYYSNGDNNSSVAVGNGSYRSNDISEEKKDELISYAANLPVIIDTEVVNAINNGTGVDPDSNMGKAISSIKSGSNTLYGFDSTKTVKIFNNENQYGNTYGGVVTVFAGSKAKGAGYDTDTCEVVAKDQDAFNNIDFGNATSNEDALTGILTASQRPKLSATIPSEYVETDSTTWITKDEFDYTYNVNGASSSDNIIVNLYVDDNGNGRFEDDEVRYTTTGSSGKFNPKDDENWIGDDFFGPVYWKLEVTDTGYGTKASKTALTKVKRTDQDKRKVKLLQIAPETPSERGADNSHTTLYLCTECQMSKRIMHGNLSISTNNGRYSADATGGLSGGHTDANISNRDINGTAKSILKLTRDSAGGTSYADTVNFNYQRTDGQAADTANTVYWGSSSINIGGTTVLRDLRPGRLKIIANGIWDKDYTIKATSGSSTIEIGNGETKEIEVDSTGIVQVNYPDPNASVSGADKSYDFITDFLTNDDENYNYNSYGNDIGTHDHKFGIVKYDAHQKSFDNTYPEGYDDWTTNWFLDFQNDYDVETTILDIPQYTEYVNNVEAIYSDISDDRDAVKAKRKTYYDDANKYYRCYQTVRKIINGTPLNQLDDPKTDDINEYDELVDYLANEMLIGADFNSGKLEYKFNTKSADDVKTMLDAFNKASSNLDSYLDTNRESIFSTNKTAGTIGCTKEEYDKEIDFYTDDSIEPTMRSYYLFFSLFTNQNDTATPNYAKLYVVWRDAKILEQYLYHEYKENEIYSSVYYEDQYSDSLVGKFNLKGAFTCVAIGCAEGFNNQDITDEDACYAIKNFADDNGSVLLFHDTLVPENVPGLSSKFKGTPTMTRILASSFGQGAVSDSTSMKNGYSLTQKTLQMGAEGHEGDSKEWLSHQTSNYFNWHAEEDNQFLHTAHDVREYYAQEKDVGADAANRVNKGIITTYPFTIDDTLKISPTNASGFTANTDDKDMVVYYTISGGSLGTSSSPFVANPNDGANNYFLYQYHNVTYTGAGHASITGKGRDNNDERRLFINVILNSARASTAGPDLTCHDYSSTDDKQTNSIILETHAKESNGLVKDKEEYVTYVESDDETPIFSFKPKAPAGVKSVKIWYDVANDGNVEKNVYNDSAGANSGHTDVLIYEINSEIAQKNENSLYFELSSTDESGNTTYSNERFSLVGDPTTLEADHVSSGKVKRISDDTTKVRLKGYTFSPVLEADGSYKYLTNADGSYVTETRHNASGDVTYRVPLVTHYSNLKLKPEYFTGDKGNCTYICVQMTDNNNKTITRTIRVEFKPELLDLN